VPPAELILARDVSVKCRSLLNFWWSAWFLLSRIDLWLTRYSCSRLTQNRPQNSRKRPSLFEAGSPNLREDRLERGDEICLLSVSGYCRDSAVTVGDLFATI
jgi:hypothetical protein